MKMPSALSSSIALLVLTGGLALSAPAQHEPARPAPAEATQATKPAPAADHSAHASAAADKPAPQAPARGDDFAQTDTDRDGRISAKEYAASPLGAVAMVAAGKRSGTEAAHGGFSFGTNEGRPDQSKFFRRLDTDGDGFLSRGELGAGQALSIREAKK